MAARRRIARPEAVPGDVEGGGDPGAAAGPPDQRVTTAVDRDSGATPPHRQHPDHREQPAGQLTQQGHRRQHRQPAQAQRDPPGAAAPDHHRGRTRTARITTVLIDRPPVCGPCSGRSGRWGRSTAASR